MSLVLCEQLEPSIAMLTLNRPEKRNALTIALMECLHERLSDLARDDACRIVILRGAGKVFCAGLDLAEASQLEVANRSAEWVAKTFDALATSDLVTIAAVHGAAMAGGAGVMSACDLVVAADDLKIGFPEVKRGLVPALVSSVLSERLRDSDMRQLFLTAEPIGAQRAYELGMVQWVVPSQQLTDKAVSVAQSICQGAPEAVRRTKRLIRELQGTRSSTAAVLATHTSARTSQEAAEGLAAFLEKREPRW